MSNVMYSKHCKRWTDADESELLRAILWVEGPTDMDNAISSIQRKHSAIKDRLVKIRKSSNWKDTHQAKYKEFLKLLSANESKDEVKLLELNVKLSKLEVKKAQLESEKLILTSTKASSKYNTPSPPPNNTNKPNNKRKKAKKDK